MSLSVGRILHSMSCEWFQNFRSDPVACQADSCGARVMVLEHLIIRPAPADASQCQPPTARCILASHFQ
jgi:hypothetical protein